jgi:hypothetical protein
VMVRTRIFFPALLFLALVPAVGRATGIHADRYEPFELSIHLHVDRSITSRAVLTDLKHETESLWSLYGVRIVWPDVGVDETAKPGLSLEAFLERRIGEEPHQPIWTPVLGRSSVTMEAPARLPIRVSFDATQSLLAARPSSRASRWGIVHDYELGRALGRVLAHEIGHVLLAAPNHADAGLMRVAFRPDELAALDRAPFRLTCICVGRLRNRIRSITGDEPRAIDRRTCVPGHIVP